jgi:ribonuclease BN (tRNA processing enzyme)
MFPRFTVLASGSAGNSNLIEVDGFGLLLDIGLGPRQLASRLITSGRSWQNVQAVLLTHTHGDHWNFRTLAALLAKRIPLYCHDEHRSAIEANCPPGLFSALVGAGLARTYRDGEELVFAGALECLPLAVRHDSGATFGFRITGRADLFGAVWSLGYAADLGSWDARLAEALSGVDILALEFNHDVAMQRSSGRHPMLIARVLGDEGHLSNAQAAELLRQTLINNSERRPRQIVQLHLSRQCNHPRLAAYAAQAVLDELGLAIPIHTATQHNPSPAFACGCGVVRDSVAAAGTEDPATERRSTESATTS